MTAWRAESWISWVLLFGRFNAYVMNAQCFFQYGRIGI